MASSLITDRMLWVDVSRYQTKLDYEVLAAEGVGGIIAKCSQGAHITDSMLVKHAEGSYLAGMRFGVYHWCDPNYSAVAQADRTERSLEQIPGWYLPVDFIAVDVEQYWKVWAEWARGNIVKVFTANEISNNALQLVHELRKREDCPVAVYTRTTFVEARAPVMATWLKAQDLWLAAWPFTRVRVECTWQELKEKWLPKISGPRLPQGSTSWTFWQWSGDKFVLPGSGGSRLDLNYFNGNRAQYQDWLWSGIIEPPKGRNLRAKYRLNVRSEPGLMTVAAITGKVEAGEIVEQLETRMVKGNNWVRIVKGWVAEVYSGVRLLDVV